MQPATKGSRLFRNVVLAACAAVAAYACRGYLWCSIHSECNPLMSPAVVRSWQVPTDPAEKAVYDESHALPLPPGMPKPIPFDFRAARISEGYGRKSVAQQYFEHLCRTEDVEVIHAVVKNVDGFQLLRPRPRMEFSPLNRDRYGAEEPTGYGWASDDNQLDKNYTFGLDEYLQPLFGVYTYVTYREPTFGNASYRAYRGSDVDPRFPNGIDSNWAPQRLGTRLNVPYVTRRIRIDDPSTRYAYTWRGIHRPRDREFGIGGGEFLIVDRQTGQVLAAKRTFNSTYVPRNPAYTNWAGARECWGLEKSDPIPRFVKRVLNPPLDVNDAYVPAKYRERYHEFLKAEIESRHTH